MKKNGLLSTGLKFSATAVTYLSVFAFILILAINLITFYNYGSFHGLFTLFITGSQLIIILLSNALKRRSFLNLHDTFFYFVIVFVFAAEILGEIFNFYEKYENWDTILHYSSGVALGFLGIAIVHLLLPKDVTLYINPFLIVLFGVFFALSMGVFWEMFELAVDQLLGGNMQKSFYITDNIDLNSFYNSFGRFNDPGLIDTMGDLFIDFMGALTAAIYTFINRPKQKLGV